MNFRFTNVALQTLPLHRLRQLCLEFGIRVKEQAQAKTCISALEEHTAIGIKFRSLLPPPSAPCYCFVLCS